MFFKGAKSLACTQYEDFMMERGEIRQPEVTPSMVALVAAGVSTLVYFFLIFRLLHRRSRASSPTGSRVIPWALRFKLHRHGTFTRRTSPFSGGLNRLTLMPIPPWCTSCLDLQGKCTLLVVSIRFLTYIYLVMALNPGRLLPPPLIRPWRSWTSTTCPEGPSTIVLWILYSHCWFLTWVYAC